MTHNYHSHPSYRHPHRLLRTGRRSTRTSDPRRMRMIRLYSHLERMIDRTPERYRTQRRVITHPRRRLMFLIMIRRGSRETNVRRYRTRYRGRSGRRCPPPTVPRHLLPFYIRRRLIHINISNSSETIKRAALMNLQMRLLRRIIRSALTRIIHRLPHTALVLRQSNICLYLRDINRSNITRIPNNTSNAHVLRLASIGHHNRTLPTTRQIILQHTVTVTSDISSSNSST